MLATQHLDSPRSLKILLSARVVEWQKSVLSKGDCRVPGASTIERSIDEFSVSPEPEDVMDELFLNDASELSWICKVVASNFASRPSTLDVYISRDMFCEFFLMRGRVSTPIYSPADQKCNDGRDENESD